MTLPPEDDVSDTEMAVLSQYLPEGAATTLRKLVRRARSLAAVATDPALRDRVAALEASNQDLTNKLAAARQKVQDQAATLADHEARIKALEPPPT